MGKTNKDYYVTAGRSTGPAGPLESFKGKLSKEQAILRRDEEHALPSERPLSGKRQPKTQARGTESGESVLDRLPKPAGAPGGRKPLPTASEEQTPGRRTMDDERTPGRRTTAASHDEREVETSPGDTALGADRGGFAVPASEDAALGHDREPFARQRELEERHPMSKTTRRLVHSFPRAFRVMGDAARAIDQPVKRVLGTLQTLGDAARNRHA